MKSKLRQNIGSIAGLLLFGVALLALHHILQQYHYRDIVTQLGALSPARFATALGLTTLGYLTLTGFDFLALRYIQHQLPYRRIALASFTGYSFSHAVGMTLVSGGSVRFRLYSSWGLSTAEITQVVAFCTFTFWLGCLTLAGMVFLLEPQAIPAALPIPAVALRPIGGLLLSLVAVYLTLSLLRRGTLRVRQWEFATPRPPVAFGQLALSLMDWSFAGSVLFLLLPAHPGLSYFGFIGLYLVAQISGLVSQVPGGLGVFESVLIVLLKPFLPAGSVLGSLLAFRVTYYLIPFVLAATLLLGNEILARREHVRRAARAVGTWAPIVLPHAFAFLIFAGGALLLLTGATPTRWTHLEWLYGRVPLPVLELSHFLASLAGVSLLLLARGLQRRLDGAYSLTLVILSAGAAFSLFRGLDYREAIPLCVALILLLPAHRYFYRRARLIYEPLGAWWTVAIVITLMSSIWLGLFSFKHVGYSPELWWQFTLHGDAPRFLRASLGAVGLVSLFGLTRLLRPTPLEPTLPSPDQLATARDIVAASPNTTAHLALLRDKALLLSESGAGFLMYGIRGQSWVAMGDPIGPDRDCIELAWRFRELCDRHGAWTVFYEVAPENLSLYVDLGLTLLKLGEEARVPLQTFDLQGRARSGLRHLHQKLEKEGCRFEVMPAAGVAAVLPQLKRVSDAWLEGTNTREKRFSLGRFDPEYIRNLPVALVRLEGRIVAFADLWLGASREELAIDLVRYLPDEAPSGVMEYLFIELMLWGREQRYKQFSLGMAPLAGLEDHALAPLWNRVGALIFRHGEHFHNFQGLRQYKERFHPDWQPRYLACPGGFALPQILANVASLISGGIPAAVTR